ncbi:4Fe-4S binding protein [Blautia massiliensis (ex Durand et al. 2017)]|uniref:4Fe-4S binding protein n=1 Tax=Blautia massiliensis (ex Durand et al. 2017) TaxID=1737424 RepID=UPI003B5094ED
MNNIVFENGKPIWGNQCTRCMACIGYCPTEAIEYGKKSIGKPRYHLQLKMK